MDRHINWLMQFKCTDEAMLSVVYQRIEALKEKAAKQVRTE